MAMASIDRDIKEQAMDSMRDASGLRTVGAVMLDSRVKRIMQKGDVGE